MKVGCSGLVIDLKIANPESDVKAVSALNAMKYASNLIIGYRDQGEQG